MEALEICAEVVRDVPDTEKDIPSYSRELSSKPIHIVLQVTLESGVTLYFDDEAGCGYGSDGNTYFPVCQEEGDGLRVIGWSAEAGREFIL